MIVYLDQGFRSFKEMLASLRLRAFLVPIDNGLVGYAVLVVQDLYEDISFIQNAGLRG